MPHLQLRAALALLACALFLKLSGAGPFGAAGDSLRLLCAELGRAERLAAQLEQAKGRLRDRRAVAEDVIAGRLSLAEAADHFRELDEADPEFVRRSRRDGYPAGSAGERYGREVIEWVRGHAGADRGLCGRLEGELAGRLRGGSCLPPGTAREGHPQQ